MKDLTYDRGRRETIQRVAKEQKSRFLRILLGSLAANLVANVFPAKTKVPARAVILAAKGTIATGLDF